MAVNGIPSARFGIKEVADVGFYAIENGWDASAQTVVDAVQNATPVIAFDTLKVSTIESTAENSEARGGKGNAALISWDYGREITVNLEDALLSMETLSLLFEGNVNGDDGVVTINANTFPGTYAVVGTTYARNESDGKDHVFKFVIPKAKIQSETTLTMEAEGDPTVIGMTLKVLRCKNGDMMQLIREEDDVTTTQKKARVTLIDTDGKVTYYDLENNTTWPTGINPEDYNDMPAKVTAGIYYKKA